MMGRSRGRTPRRSLPMGAILALGLFVSAGCAATSASSDGAQVTTVETVAAVEAGAASAVDAFERGATVIDVRTPEEYVAGHIDGAELVDIQDPDFDVQIATLDQSKTYVVYCRSGNRSAVAAERMRDAGLMVLDGGGLDDMSAAGWPVTR